MDLDKIAEEMMQKHNSTPIDDFDGFCPDEMYDILHDPFTENCPIQFEEKITDTILKEIPIFNIVREFLSMMIGNDGLELTPKGNLKLKTVKELYDKKYIADESLESGYVKRIHEDDWRLLHTVRVVLDLSGMIRKYKGKLKVLKEIRKLYDDGDFSNIFFEFLQAYTTQFNWAYNDRYENEEIGQAGFLFLLYLVNKFGSDYQDLSFYTEWYIKAFPVFRQKAENGVKYTQNENTIYIRFFERFARWFGFVDIRIDKNKDYSQRTIKIKKTEILSAIMK